MVVLVQYLLNEFVKIGFGFFPDLLYIFLALLKSVFVTGLVAFFIAGFAGFFFE
jgi:hypothetical protein